MVERYTLDNAGMLNMEGLNKMKKKSADNFVEIKNKVFSAKMLKISVLEM